MKDFFPKSFYFKLLFIIMILSLTYYQNQTFISATLSNSELSTNKQISLIVQEVLLENGTKQKFEDEIIVENTVSPGNTEPYLVDSQVQEHPRYLYAAEKANEFNQNLNLDKLNKHFVDNSNELRKSLDWQTMKVADYLMDGSQNRVEELSRYHYLSPYTKSGQEFRQHFPEIESSQYRLGENLYELFISAGDILLTTWENEEILADYLYQVFEESIGSSNYHVYHSQYINVRAEATDYQIQDTPYVRLVVTLLLDTHS